MKLNDVTTMIKPSDDLEAALDVANLVHQAVLDGENTPIDAPYLNGDTCWYPVIAGGAPRDLALGRAVKDYDIFMPIPRMGVMAATLRIVDALRENGEPFVINNGSRDYGAYCGRPEMLGCIRLVSAPVDIILFDSSAGKTPEAIVSTFDTSISRCWIESLHMLGTGYVDVRYAFDFARSVQERKIWTYLHVPTRPAHVARVADKYPDFNLIIADPDLAREVDAYRRVTREMAAESYARQH